MSTQQQKPILATTKYCAVFGHPIHHSASPAMHNAAIANMGINWRYLAYDVHPNQLAQALEGAKAMRFVGLNLTVPHKILALDLVDVVDHNARQWGAVNTILFEGQTFDNQWLPLHQLNDENVTRIRSRGFNTDADAIVRAVQEDLSQTIKGAKILLLGAGGAGRVAALKFAAEGAKSIYLVNRTRAKALQVELEIKSRFPMVQSEVGYPLETVDLVVNATSLGLSPDDPLPFDEEAYALNRARKAYDLIYRPAETRFLKRARQCGCEVANGLGMLLYQGARAFEIWSGLAAPTKIMRTALHESIYGKS